MLGGKLRFFHLVDERKIDITCSESLGEFFSWSPDGKKLLFYRSSYDWRSILKVVSASGGPSTEFGRNLTLWAYDQFWSPDSKAIVTPGESEDGDYGFWILPLEGSKPSQLEFDVSVPDETNPLYLSPTRSKLLFSVKRNDDAADLWVVSISLEDGRTTGPAVMVFSGWVRSRRYGTFSWSPDGKKLAVIYEGDMWIASADGSEPIQIKKTPEDEREPKWSPDGGMIAYTAYHSEQERALMVISASGGKPTKILDIAHGSAEYTWSPDGKELAILSSERAYGKEGMLFFRDEGMISTISITDGKSRRILDLKDQPADQIWGITWSPDGSKIAFAGWNGEAELRHQVFVIPAEGGEVIGVAAESGSAAAVAMGLSWSPDGKWISYAIEGPVKIRPEGAIWEADVSELLSGMEKEQ